MGLQEGILLGFNVDITDGLVLGTDDGFNVGWIEGAAVVGFLDDITVGMKVGEITGAKVGSPGLGVG